MEATDIGIIAAAIFVLGNWLIQDPEADSYRFNTGIFFLIISVALPTVISFMIEEIYLNILSILLFGISAFIIIQGMIEIPNGSKLGETISQIAITRFEVIDWRTPKKSVNKSHGLRFVYLKNILYGVIIFPAKKVNVPLPDQKLITPDGATNFVPFDYTFTPGPNLYNFKKAGGEEGVKAILNSQIHEKARMWASSEKEGPKTWQDMRGAGDEAISVLIKMIAGENLEPINFEIFTWRMFQYYEKAPFYPSERKTEKNERAYIKKKIEALPPAEQQALKERIERRWALILKLRQGNGTQVIDSLGITLNRFNVGEVGVDKKLEEAIEKRVIKKAEAEGQKMELDNLRSRIEEYIYEMDDKGKFMRDANGKRIKTGVSEQAAIELIQSESNVVPKKIEVSRKELGFDKTTLDAAGPIIALIVSAFKKGGQS